MKANLAFTLTGCPRSKKNSMQIVKIKMRDKATGQLKEIPKLLPSTWYRQYEICCVAQIRELLQPMYIDHPINLKVTYYMENRRGVDLCNLLEATCDILVKAGVLKDDNSRIVVSHDGSRVNVDKERPRCVVEISEAKCPIQQSMFDDWSKDDE